jgi:alpha-N-arabinofuranosidase
MANIAQTVNVLQSVILTEGNQMVKTPTYYVFKMYKVHHDATFVPMSISSEKYSLGDQSIPAIHASCSKDKFGIMHLSMANLNPNSGTNMECILEGKESIKVTNVEIITAGSMNAFNDFGEQEAVNIRLFDDVFTEGNKLTINIPPKSIIQISME